MNDEHDDDMTAEVSENAAGESDDYAVVAEDIEARDVDEENDRLHEMNRNLEEAEGDDVEEG
jgi:hypothetical protein